MLPSIIICSVTCVLMILSILFFPKLHIGKLKVDAYWLITLCGAAAVLIFRLADIKNVLSALTADTSVNPLKILVLFISMTALSIFLDELGFFSYLATLVLKKARTGQKKLFISLFLTVAILTIFTSNDIIILSFTPFVCYFAKNAKIDPTPYLAAEFVAANTFSLALIIGNPTNIYLASSCNIDFLSYLKISILPTIFAGTTAFIMLFLLFRKKLSQPLCGEAQNNKIEDMPLTFVALAHLALCTIFLAIASYIRLEMWLISLIFAVSLFVISAVIFIIRRQKPTKLLSTLKRLPYQLIPFVISMFVLIVALESSGATNALGKVLLNGSPILNFGIISFLSANLINNIPMSILFSSIIQSIGEASNTGIVFATIIGSNLGALLTPIGALAGIMWSSILHSHRVKFTYLDFLKIGITVAVPALFAALGGLSISIFLLS